MRSIWGRLTAALLVAAATVAFMAGAPPRPASDLRVCADPYDMPFSNSQGEGFENKIAQLVARDLNATVINYWWPSRRGVLRNSILGGFCDVMIQAPVGLDPVATTKPYYRSTYYFVFRADRGLQLRSLDDTLLKRLKIGVNMIGYDYTNTPPAHALGSRGIVGLVGFGNFLNPDPKAEGHARFGDRPPARRDHGDSASVQRADDRDAPVRTKHFVRGGLVGAWVTAAIVMAWAPAGRQRAAAAAAPRDTMRDSLLVSDSIYQGWKWWHVYCFRCHGEDAMRPILPNAPDLRWAVSPTGANFPRDSFFNTAWNGRPTKGMPAWNVLLDSAAINEVYVYVKARSDGWLKPGRPHRLSDLQQKNKSP